MDERPALRRPASRARRIASAYAWSFAAWTAFASLMVLIGAVASGDLRRAGLDIRPWQWGAYNLVYYYAWALFTPAIVYFGLRFRIDRDTWPRRLPLHLLAALVAAAAFIGPRLLVATYGTRWIGFPPRPPRTDLSGLLIQFTDNVYVVVQILVASQAIGYYRAFREREVRAAQLEAELVRSQLAALRAQVQPHFLFNTLHSAATLMERDVAGARRMLALLSDLLRRSLDTLDTQEVELREELDFLDRYLEIERVRFPDRLAVVMDVAPETLDAAVPAFLLQLLVENAIRHGIAPRSEPGRVEVRARKDASHLRIEVRDTGPGPAESSATAARAGLGLANTRLRLQRLYGERQSLDLTRAPEGGGVVTVVLPFARVGHGAEGRL